MALLPLPPSAPMNQDLVFSLARRRWMFASVLLNPLHPRDPPDPPDPPDPTVTSQSKPPSSSSLRDLHQTPPHSSPPISLPPSPPPDLGHHVSSTRSTTVGQEQRQLRSVSPEEELSSPSYMYLLRQVPLWFWYALVNAMPHQSMVHLPLTAALASTPTLVKP
ncbi:hypothetical protein Bca101_073373 [Brassica carinata]